MIATAVSTGTNNLPDKYLLALKCLQAAPEIDAENPKLHEQSVRFRQASRCNRMLAM